jgi:hypothetical protein
MVEGGTTIGFSPSTSFAAVSTIPPVAWKVSKKQLFPDICGRLDITSFVFYGSDF